MFMIFLMGGLRAFSIFLKYRYSLYVRGYLSFISSFFFARIHKGFFFSSHHHLFRTKETLANILKPLLFIPTLLSCNIAQVVPTYARVFAAFLNSLSFSFHLFVSLSLCRISLVWMCVYPSCFGITLCS